MSTVCIYSYNNTLILRNGESIMGISMPQLLIILLVVALIFGTKKLRNIGNDLGSAVKGFKNGINDDEKQELNDQSEDEVAQANSNKEDPVQK